MTKRSPFKHFKTIPEIIRLAEMLYVRLPLSFRNVENLLHERGVQNSHKTVRYWWHQFGPMFATEVQKRRIEWIKSSLWRWRLDEMIVRINGERRRLQWAVNHEGQMLESFVTKTHDKKAVLKFRNKAMHKFGQPEVIVTDKLRSHCAALKEIAAEARQETGRWVNNLAEKSHLPLRRRERVLRFMRMRPLQKFASVHASVLNHFNSERHLYSRAN